MDSLVCAVGFPVNGLASIRVIGPGARVSRRSFYLEMYTPRAVKVAGCGVGSANLLTF